MSSAVDVVDATLNHPWPYLYSIFEIVDVNDILAHVKCLLCLPKQKVLSSALNSPSNLQKHVKVSVYSFFIVLLGYFVECNWLLMPYTWTDVARFQDFQNAQIVKGIYSNYQIYLNYF